MASRMHYLRQTMVFFGVLLATAVLVIAAMALGPPVRQTVCDGVFPKWVLDAQGYEGGGCADLLPIDKAPPNADWTPICTGVCLCPQGQLYIDSRCAAVPSDRPWPATSPYRSEL